MKNKASSNLSKLGVVSLDILTKQQAFSICQNVVEQKLMNKMDSYVINAKVEVAYNSEF